MKEEKMFEEIPKNCRYGYARVSSKSQEDNSYLESQKELNVPEKNIRVEIEVVYFSDIQKKKKGQSK
jgi:hypothetical protein